MAAMLQVLSVSSGRKNVTITISADTQNYTLNTAKVSGYLVGATDVTFVVNSDVYLGSASTGSYALTIDTSWHPADNIKITNNGYIVGAAGAGGAGGASTAAAGGSGGNAVYAQRVVTFTNNGTVGSGGGGGGGGKGNAYTTSYQVQVGTDKFGPVYETRYTTSYWGGGGGGGGQGYSAGSGGAGGQWTNGNGGNGTAGTKTGAGTGGLGANNAAGTVNGAGGGVLGSAGTGSSAAGGAAAACLVGKSYVNAGAGITGTTFGGQS